LIETTYNLYKSKEISNINNVCTFILKVSRQYFYKAIKKKLQKETDEILIVSLLKDIHSEHPSFGCVKLYKKLLEILPDYKLHIGRDRALKLMKVHDIKVGRVRKHPTYKPSLVHSENKNLLFTTVVNRPNQVWLSDITFVPLANNYLVRVAFVMDCYSRKILSYDVGNHADIVPNSVMKSLVLYGKPEIFHSDRGFEYQAAKVTDPLTSNEVKISLSRKATPTDNAIMERTIGIIKNELKLSRSSSTIAELEENVSKVVNYFNSRRIHKSLDYQTPNSVFEQRNELAMEIIKSV
jgi:putative transposase